MFIFSDLIVKLVPMLRMTSDWKTREEKMRERKSQQLVTQIYTVCLFVVLYSAFMCNMCIAIQYTILSRLGDVMDQSSQPVSVLAVSAAVCFVLWFCPVFLSVNPSCSGSAKHSILSYLSASYVSFYVILFLFTHVCCVLY